MKTAKADLSGIRQTAKTMSQNLDTAKQGMIGMGFNAGAVEAFVKGKQDFLNGIMSTRPPAHLERILAEAQKKDGK